MPDNVSKLFDEFAARYARGERPDAREYLAQAGDQRAELATMLDRFVILRPPPDPDEDSVTVMGAWLEGQPTLLSLRVSRGLTREAVVDVLVKTLGLKRRDKVAGYYHRLENGMLDPERVDRRVFAALADALRARIEDVRPWPGRPGHDRKRLLPPGRHADLPRRPTRRPPADASVAPDEPEDRWDEVDELFLGPRT